MEEISVKQRNRPWRRLEKRSAFAVHGIAIDGHARQTGRLLFASRLIREVIVVLLKSCTAKELDEHEASLLTRHA
jgi:hypothetical protein